jgi:hypothetical protein
VSEKYIKVNEMNRENRRYVQDLIEDILILKKVSLDSAKALVALEKAVKDLVKNRDIATMLISEQEMVGNTDWDIEWLKASIIE